MDHSAWSRGATIPRMDGTGDDLLAQGIDRAHCQYGVGPAHLVGNSLGGWVALELAEVRPASSLTLLSPAGLWRGRTPLYCRASLRATGWLSRHAGGVLSRWVDHRIGRILVLGQTHGRPTRMTPEQARATIRAAGSAPGYEATLRATLPRNYVSRGRIHAPVTVAFGGRDVLLLPWQSRHLDQLPPGALVHTLPGCGHIPVADDPAAVVALIGASTRRDATGGGLTDDGRSTG